MKKKNSLLVLVIAAIIASIFGFSNSDSKKIANSLLEQIEHQTPTPSIQLPITGQTVQGTSDSNVPGVQAQVIKVVDGDTIRVIFNNTEKTVRLIGVNTPETVDPRREVECFGKEASNYAKTLLANKSVYLEADASQGDQDKYQRLLRYVWLDAQTNVNKLLIAEGYAYEYTYDLPYKYQIEFQQAQTEAQNAKRGLWSDTTCKGEK